MRYKELMEAGNYNRGLSGKILDILTPIASTGVEYISMDQLIDKIKHMPTGLKIDREFVLDVLDPNKFSMIQKIEGDKVFLNLPQEIIRKVSDPQKEQESDKIKDTATQQAQKAVKS